MTHRQVNDPTRDAVIVTVFSAPKGQNNVARGRAAHPGYDRPPIPPRPEGAQHDRADLLCPFRAWMGDAIRFPRVRWRDPGLCCLAPSGRKRNPTMTRTLIAATVAALA